MVIMLEFFHFFALILDTDPPLSPINIDAMYTATKAGNNPEFISLKLIFYLFIRDCGVTYCGLVEQTKKLF
jgi:hypothetical protein